MAVYLKALAPRLMASASALTLTLRVEALALVLALRCWLWLHHWSLDFVNASYYQPSHVVKQVWNSLKMFRFNFLPGTCVCGRTRSNQCKAHHRPNLVTFARWRYQFFAFWGLNLSQNLMTNSENFMTINFMTITVTVFPLFMLLVNRRLYNKQTTKEPSWSITIPGYHWVR